MTLGSIIILAVLALISVHTVSFGLWTWKKKNKSGAVMVFAVALANLALPIYSLLFRE